MEWFSYTAVIAGLGFLMNYLIQKKIDSYFSMKLENHKKELTVMTEKAKYDVNRKLFDFEAYAIKKHAIYPELYHRIFEVRQQLTVFISKMGMSYKTDSKMETSLKLVKHMKEIDFAIIHVEEYFNNNELFLSKHVVSTYLETWDLLMILQKDFYDNEYNRSYAREEVSKIQEKVEKLKEVIFKELSYSHFEEIEKKSIKHP